VHTPIEAKQPLIDKYRRKIQPGDRHQNAAYAAMVETLDVNIGRVLQKLQDRGLADRTIVLFLSDNGGYLSMRDGRKITNNAPLRSGKGSLYEGGVRVPLIVRAPGRSKAGEVCADPVACFDLLPTLAELVGLALPEGLRRSMDGRSFASLLERPETALPARDLFSHYPHYYPTTTPVSAVRSGDFKLLEYFEDSHVELFDLAHDPGESRDLSVQEPARAADLRRRLHAWRKEIGAQTPTKNSAHRASADE
jgi:arylsulfatase A-like enzyme